MRPLETLILHNGTTLPTLGLGTSTWTWENPKNLIYNAVKEAIRCGYRHFDTAEYYNTERDVGRAITQCVADGLITREEVVVVTKVYRSNMDAASTEESCRASLKNLNLSYIDIYLIHNPMALDKSVGFEKHSNDLFERGLFADIDYLETWRAMESLVKKGLVKSIGVSNFSVEQIQRMVDEGLTKPVCNQIEVSPYCPNTQVLEYCKAHNIAVVAFASLGSPARITRKEEDKVLLDEQSVLKIAKEIGKSPAQVLLRWAIQKGCSILPKSTNPERIKTNAQVFDFELSPEDMGTLDNIGHFFRVCSFPESVKHPHYPFHDD